MMDVSVCIQQTQYRVESTFYGIYALVFVSEILIRQQRVVPTRAKYRTPALSMKYSLYIRLKVS